MTAHNPSQNRSYTLWTVAGAVLLAGLVVGLSHQGQADDRVVEHIVPVPPQSAPRIDVVFTIDATGSMGDEIDMVKKEIWSIANRLMEGKPRPDIRFGLVFYQDRSDSFLVKRTDLTRDIDKVHDQLMAITAGGGGDWREHVGRGLHEALAMAWDTSPNAARLIYLVGDAPGHDDYNDGYDIKSAVAQARQKGIKINAIGCSGLGEGVGEFRSLTERTGGAFTHLTYQAVVTDSDGVQRSAVYYDGELYEAEGVMDKKEWGRGADRLVREGKLKPARKSVRAAAPAPAAADNNIDDLLFDSVKGEAEEKGAIY